MTIDTNKLNQVIAIAKSRTSDGRWLRAIDKAVEGLKAGWCYTELQGHWLITTEGDTYKVNGVCNCPAAQYGNPICKHRAFKRLVELYNQTPDAPAAAVANPIDEKAEVIAQLKAAWHAKYTAKGNRKWTLAGLLFDRFGTTAAEEIHIDYLRQILKALSTN